MEHRRIRVVIADDIQAVRRGMAAVLTRDAGIEVVGTAENGKRLIELCAEERPDVAVVDIRMLVMDGVEAARWLRANLPSVRILILTTFDDEEYIQELLSIGIDGYILKGGDNLSFVGAVKSVHMGVNTLAPEILAKLSAMLRPQPERGQAGLSEIERRVAELIGRDYHNKDIATELGLTYGRVRNIVSGIYRKLGVTERDLIREFISGDAEDFQ